MDFEAAPDVQERVAGIVSVLGLDYVNVSNVVCMRSRGSKARAYARIWALPRIWQAALGVQAHYVLEVLSEYFDSQSYEDQTRTLIHELMHVPKGFSGALVPHKCFGKRIDKRSVEKLYTEYKKKECVL